jgi:anti-sigma regulatory factor (Ser/Thr protein kinase)
MRVSIDYTDTKMGSYIAFRSRSLKSLCLSFPPEGEFRAVVDTFGEIGYPSLPVNSELISFALLELVSNSIRAHRERKVADPVAVRLEAADEEFRATVLDAGRGFDPSRLPYDLFAPASDVDIMSDSFAAYREEHGGSRFGMGLYVAKKTFSRFSLQFVDAQEQPCPWFSGAVRGTRIELGLPFASIPDPVGEAKSEEVEAFLEPQP